MRFTAAALIAGAAVVTATPQYGYGYGPVNTTTPAGYAPPPSYTTEVVTAYTTYCPGPTQVTYGTQTYTVTEATTLTITNCPCTITKPVYSSVYSSTYCPPASPTPPSPPVYTPAPVANGTVVPAPPAYTPAPPTYTGAANKASFGVAGLLAAAGLVAAL